MTQCGPRRTVVPGCRLTFTLILVAIMCLCSCRGTVSGTNHSEGEAQDRSTRDVDVGIRFTPLEIRSALSTYNSLRSRPKDSSNMRIMEWDRGLMNKAMYWVGFCDKKRKTPAFHNQKTAIRIFVSNAPSYYTSKAVRDWNSDTRRLFRMPFTCIAGDQCINLKKVTLALTDKLGCAKKYCDGMGGSNLHKSGHLIACLHYPTARMKGLPYTRGRVCSRCPTGYNHCIRRLCSCFLRQANLVSPSSKSKDRYVIHEHSDTKLSRKRAKKATDRGTALYPCTALLTATATVVIAWTLLGHDRMA